MHGASVSRRHRDRIPNPGYDPKTPKDAAFFGFRQKFWLFVTAECGWRWQVSGEAGGERLAADISKSPDPFVTVQKCKTDGGKALSLEGIRVISEQPKRKPNLATQRLCEKRPRTASLQHPQYRVCPPVCPPTLSMSTIPKSTITPVPSSSCPSSLRVKPPRARDAGAVGTGAAASGRLRSRFIASLRNDTRRVPSEWPESAPRQNTGRLDRCTLALTDANF